MPAPRPFNTLGARIDALPELTEELRQVTREARETLTDLHTERKSVEQLARTRAEEAITQHVNSCLTELTKHVNEQLISITGAVRSYMRDLTNSVAHSTESPEPPSQEQLVRACDVFARAMAHGMMEPPEGFWEGTMAAGDDGV